MKNHDFELNEIIVDSSDLVLDPNNPRIQNGNYSQKKFTDSEIISPDVQRYILKKMHEKEHAVPKLIESMKSNGFVNIDSIFVKRLPSVNKFLVLEGNRRTTAIKHLLENSHTLDQKILQSIKKIPVKELICDDLQLQEDMTDFILSIRHLGGVKDWAPMQQAYSIYSTFMREWKKQSGLSEFRKDVEMVAKISSILNQEKKDIWKALRIYVAFDQLKQNEYLVKSDHYTLLDLAVNTYPSLRSKFFEVQESTFRMSSKGLRRFNKLCVEENCRVNNPQEFKDFFQIFKHGSEADLMMALESDENISELKLQLLNNKKKSFCSELETIKNKIGELVIADFKQTSEEIKLIKEIKRTVDRKLYSLID